MAKTLQITQQTISDALSLLLLHDALRAYAYRVKCQGDSDEARTDWQRTVERARRRAALTAHPDRGGTVEAMQQINAAADLLKSARVAPPQPRWVVVRSWSPWSTSTTTTSSTTSATGVGWY